MNVKNPTPKEIHKAATKLPAKTTSEKEKINSGKILVNHKNKEKDNKNEK